MTDASNDRVATTDLETVAEIARRLAESLGLDDLLHRIVVLAHEYVEGCDGVSLMLIGRGGWISTPAYSSRVARDSDQAQFETDQGPCLESIREHHTVHIDDLKNDGRWPAYRDRVVGFGVRSMLGVRLFVLGDTMGALNFYSSRPHAFGERSVLLAQVFASHAAVALKAAISEAGMQAALETRDVIGQAKGVLMARAGLTADGAFARLRELSQTRHQPVRELAEEIAATGAVPNGDGG
jgi:GAF domain-containing protein